LKLLVVRSRADDWTIVPCFNKCVVKSGIFGFSTPNSLELSDSMSQCDNLFSSSNSPIFGCVVDFILFFVVEQFLLLSSFIVFAGIGSGAGDIPSSGPEFLGLARELRCPRIRRLSDRDIR
jgi:hypothetical protein